MLSLPSRLHMALVKRIRKAWSQKVTGAVWDLALPNDASFVAAGSGITGGERAEDLTGELLLFDRRGRLQWSRPSKTGVHSVSTCADGSLIVTTIDEMAQACDKDGRLLWTHQMPSRVGRVSVNQKGTIVAVASARRLDVLDKSGNLRWSKDFSGVVAGVELPRTGRIIAVLSWEWRENEKKNEPNAWGLLSVFDDSGTLRWYRSVELAGICDADIHLATALSEDGSTIAIGSPSPKGRLLVLNDNGGPLWSDSTTDDVLSTAISGDGSVVALGSSDFRLHVFDGRDKRSWTRTTGGDPVHYLAGDFALQVSPDGTLIAAGAGDGNMYVFDRTGEPALVKSVGTRLQSVEFATEGSFFAAGTSDGKVHAFELS